MAGGVNVVLTGDWDRLRNTLSHLNTNFRIQAVNLIKQQLDVLNEAIWEQAYYYEGKPYHPSRPKNTGVWWVETEELLNHLEVKNIQSGDIAYFVGWSEGSGDHGLPRKNPLPYDTLAEILEDAHPLVSKVWDKYEPRFRQEWDDLVLKAIRGGV